MTFEAAMARLHALGRFGSPGAVERVAWILEQLGSPHERLRCVHVAGTNGKGSTCAMIAAVLQKAGYRTGLFISPYILEFCERMQIDGEMIPKTAFAALADRVFPFVEQLHQRGERFSEFEVVTMIALLWFWEQDCDFVVLETGIGGKRDATNVIATPMAAVLTPISMDHTALLGETLSEIATDKCGIMKEGGVVISAPDQAPEVLAVIEQEAQRSGSRLIVADMADMTVQHMDLYGTDFVYAGQMLYLPLLGEHQMQNACTALTVLEELRRQHIVIEPLHLQEGFAQVRFPARWEVMSRQPLVIVDGAHNRAGVDTLKVAMEQYLAGRNVIGIAGALQDKDTEYLTHCLCGKFSQVLTVMPDNPRALQSDVFAQQWRDVGQLAVACETSEQALEQALQVTGEDGVVLVFGSLFTAAQLRAEVLRYFEKK